MSVRAFLTMTGMALLLGGPAQAETLHRDTPVSSSQAMVKPARGATMDAVQQLLGSPLRKADPVGEPPITRWEYPGFIVYFEYQRVIHTVTRHAADRG